MVWKKRESCGSGGGGGEMKWWNENKEKAGNWNEWNAQ